MDSDRTAKREKREITYQVGWKRGKIQRDEPGGHHSQREDHEERGDKLWRLLVRYAWKQAPILTPPIALPLLIALPAVSFILTLVMVYKLTHE